jgi:hypothetical protein
MGPRLVVQITRAILKRTSMGNHCKHRPMSRWRLLEFLFDGPRPWRKWVQPS